MYVNTEALPPYCITLKLICANRLGDGYMYSPVLLRVSASRNLIASSAIKAASDPSLLVFDPIFLEPDFILSLSSSLLFDSESMVPSSSIPRARTPRMSLNCPYFPCNLILLTCSWNLRFINVAARNAYLAINDAVSSPANIPQCQQELFHQHYCDMHLTASWYGEHKYVSISSLSYIHSYHQSYYANLFARVDITAKATASMLPFSIQIDTTIQLFTGCLVATLRASTAAPSPSGGTLESEVELH
ncbi:1686_t:CDS:2, partial [Acaulospora colombiana]